MIIRIFGSVMVGAAMALGEKLAREYIAPKIIEKLNKKKDGTEEPKKPRPY